MLMEEYDTRMGIFDHRTRDGPDGRDTRPMAAIAMHPKEQYAWCGPIAQRFARYMLYDLQRFGITWEIFKRNTRFENELAFRFAEQYNTRTTAAIGSLPPVKP